MVHVHNSPEQYVYFQQYLHFPRKVHIQQYTLAKLAVLFPLNIPVGWYDFPQWIVIPDILGSITPELIINQQEFLNIARILIIS